MSIGFFVVLALGGNARAEEVLEWTAAAREARLHHPDLLSAADKIDKEKAAKEITRSVAMPQITGTGSETTTKSASSSAGSSSSSSKRWPPPTTYTYGATGQQLLFDGFKTSYDLSTAERNIQASRYNYDVTSSNIRLRLRTAFANLLGAQELLKVTEGIQGRRKQNLELVRLRYEGGREHRGSLMTSEADVAQASFDVRQAHRAIYLAQRQLTKEMGRSLFVPMVAQGDFAVREADPERPDFDLLAETNPLLRQLIAKKEAAKFGLRSAYAQFFPTIYATGSAGNTANRWFPDKNQWSVGTSVSLPIFDGGNRLATVDQARAVLGQMTEDERSGRDGVIFTLSDTWTKLQDAVDKVKVQKKYLEATEERARIAEAEYAIGLLSFDNWIIIEDNLVSAKKNYLNAEVAALTAEANWIQAKGETLDHDQAQ